MAKVLKVDIWSDIACPWCYIGKRRFESALGQFASQAANQAVVQVTWRSFQLNPAAEARPSTAEPYAVRLSKKYGNTVADAEQRIRQIVELAASEGLPFDFEHIQPGNTLAAHRLVHLAREHGLQDALKERLLRAYLCEGAWLGDHETLLRLANEVGLDVDQAQGVLASDLYLAEVRADQREASALGIGGVPFFRIGRYGVSGAQPAELLLRALNQAFSELPEPLETLGEEASVCGPDGCV